MPVLPVNRRPHELDLDPDTALLWAPRDDLQLSGTQFARGIAAGLVDAIPGSPTRLQLRHG